MTDYELIEGVARHLCSIDADDHNYGYDGVSDFDRMRYRDEARKIIALVDDARVEPQKRNK